MAELHWPSELDKSFRQGRLCTPAHFENDTQNDWSLYVWFDKPVNPGEIVTVPVTPLVTEAAEKILRPGAEFRLFLKPDLYALGRVVTVSKVSEEDMRCVFHFC
ncbi:MAG: hypothetical protein ACRYFS_18430 [Janthinobacterium lividum]